MIECLKALFFTCSIGVVGTIWASFCEWTLHKRVMHKRINFFSYPFEKHAMVHHQIFKADETYHLIDEKDKMTIPMAWWNGTVLALIGSIPFWIFSLSTWYHPFLIPWDAFCVIFGYYCTYEYLHWCMHLPRWRRLEFTWVFQRLNGHHLLHHRYMGKNFNVVLPLFDFIFRTLIVRSKLHFKQATGYAVPDVQPLGKRASLLVLG